MINFHCSGPWCDGCVKGGKQLWTDNKEGKWFCSKSDKEETRWSKKVPADETAECWVRSSPITAPQWYQAAHDIFVIRRPAPRTHVWQTGRAPSKPDSANLPLGRHWLDSPDSISKCSQSFRHKALVPNLLKNLVKCLTKTMSNALDESRNDKIFIA
jgi:hypothetical protein